MEQAISQTMAVGTVDIGPLRDSLGFLLRMAQLQTFEHYFTEGSFALKLGEFSVLTLILHNPGIRQGVLAQRLMIKRAHMTKLIRTMEKSGYVERTIPDEDRRSVTLRLTPEGREATERHWLRFLSYDQAPKSQLSPRQEQQLISLLQAFVGLDAERMA